MSDSMNTRRPNRDRGDQPRDLSDLTDKGKETTTRYTVDLPDSLHHRFKVQAAQDGRSMKDLVIEALEAHLNDRM